MNVSSPSRSRLKPFVVSVVSIAVLLMVTACVGFMTHSNEIRITYVSHTDASLDVTVDNGMNFRLHPGESHLVIGSKSQHTRHVEARDRSGALRFERTISMGDFAQSNFEVVIEGTRRPASPMAPAP